MKATTTRYFDEDGHLNDLGVATYAEALQEQRQQKLSKAMLEHVAECQSCKVEIASLTDLLSVDAVAASAPTMASETISWFQRIAAILLLAGILGSYLWFLEQQKQPEALAENFVPAPALEAMVDDIYRAGETTFDSPDYLHQIGDEIVFHWNTTAHGEFTIVVLNNSGEEVQRESTQLNRIVLRPDWPPGLFYWKLQNQEDLLFVGKLQIGQPPE